ncbi:APC family permease [Pedobacter xixiisoli]|uniref:Amino acid/polyamine/organocation transporter, APC superfamily n=1 Tax=Pedobacter xixiisoli TaxID=1476464 RepID=A0A285ZW23_9SPHI|nr:amino acid permease [Pedobacter xixiisoli]SOD13844.1 amino acid/polyamine/organocation transporter, APC superfamily [Pedobacter xixiisoli]
MQNHKIGLWPATALVVASMIGTGVFTSLGFQVAGLPSVAILLLLWAIGGLVAFCGALSYIHLAKLVPGTGGEYHYINSCYPNWLATGVGPISVLSGFIGPIALSCMTVAAYAGAIFPALPRQLFAFFVVLLVSLPHLFNIKWGSRFQMMLTAIKVLLILVLIIFGLQAVPKGNPILFSEDDKKLLFSNSFAISLVYVSFAYSGWNACVYIFSEISDAERTIKRSILLGCLLVVVLYLLLNYIFLRVLPFKVMDGKLEIGVLAAKQLFGANVGSWLGGLMAALLLATISAMVWIGPRIIARFARDWKLHVMARNNGKGIPFNASLLQLVLVSLMIFTGTFKQVMFCSALLMNLIALLAVLILFRKNMGLSIAQKIAPCVFVLFNLWSLTTIIRFFFT